MKKMRCKKFFVRNVLLLLGCTALSVASGAVSDQQMQQRQAQAFEQLNALQNQSSNVLPTPNLGSAMPQAPVVVRPNADGGMTFSSPSQNYDPARLQKVLSENTKKQKQSVPSHPSSNVNGASSLHALGSVWGKNNDDADQSENNNENLDLNEIAFQKMARSLLPMSTSQIRRLKEMFAAAKQASAAGPGVPPRPTATSAFVNLAPGATPPVIRLGQGFVTSLLFLDSNGQPWPIASYDLGNPNAFDIKWDQKDNTLMIQAVTMFTYGNIAVRLRGLDTPVMITLIPSQKAVDYRVDMRVPGLGPNSANLPTGDGLPTPANPALLSVLDGVPPANSHLLTVHGEQAEAWMGTNNVMYLRTRYPVLSPGWIASLSSADGMHAYEMEASPAVLISVAGQPSTLMIEGF